MDRKVLEECLAAGMSLEAMAKRFDRHPSTVSYHLQKHGLVPPGHANHAPNAKVEPARLAALIEGGATIREAAAAFEVGYSTIRYWMKKLDLNTDRGRRLKATSDAAEGRPNRVVMTCPKHGEVEFMRRPDSGYRCSKCRTESVSEWRRRIKRRLIEQAGGRCVICDYDRCPGALHFHHLDPSTKAFVLSRHGVTRSFAEVSAEATKCALLCANCHAEVEAGMTVLPATFSSLELPGD